MIVTTPDSNRPRDPRNRAGLEAERQMAFYLRRGFERKRGVWVFNDLRFSRNGDAAQIDHLVLHPAGMVIVESKSVTGEIRVNARGEWTRRSNGRRPEGMRSPVGQARLQAEFLLTLLRENNDRILDGQLGGLLPNRFGRWWPIDILVAVSDRGRISRETDVPELVKADQVVETIRAIIQKHKRGRWSPNPLNTAGDSTLKKEELGRLVEFLRLSHTPRRESAATPRELTAPEPAAPGGESTAGTESRGARRNGFESLRSLRRDIAREEGVPPYMVFNDATLLEMVERRPQTRGELLRIKGVGPVKVEKYGPRFLRVLAEA